MGGVYLDSALPCWSAVSMLLGDVTETPRNSVLPPMSIESAIRKAVGDCGKTQAQLSRESGMTQAAVSYFVNQGMHLSGDKLERLAAAAGVRIVCKPIPKRQRNGNQRHTKADSGSQA